MQNATVITSVLQIIDRYLDAVPRSGSQDEAVGPFTLFRSTTAATYYARPQLGLQAQIDGRDITRLAERCAELDLEVAIEGVAELTPSLLSAAEAAGLNVTVHPLLCLDPAHLRPVAAPAGVTLRRLEADDPALVLSRAVAEVAFGEGGVTVGRGGPAERDAQAVSAARAELMYQRAAAGLAVHVGAFDPSDGLVSAGQHQPIDGASEIMAVATLPYARRRGLAQAVTTTLVQDAHAAGVGLMLLSAQDDDVARVYERVGFARVGHAVAVERPA